MGLVLGVGGKLKAGNTIHSEANSRVPLSGSIDPVVDRRSFTGSAKDHL